MNAKIVGKVRARNQIRVEEDSVLFPIDPKLSFENYQYEVL